LRRQASFKWAQFRKPDGAMESPNPSPQKLEHDVAPLQRHPSNEVQISPVERSRMQQIPAQDSPGSGQSQSRSHRTDNADAYKSFKLTLEDPTWKVLPAALKKYRINNDSWQNYAMFIRYESGGQFTLLILTLFENNCSMCFRKPIRTLPQLRRKALVAFPKTQGSPEEARVYA
jgi:hypothetical protein